MRYNGSYSAMSNTNKCTNIKIVLAKYCIKLNYIVHITINIKLFAFMFIFKVSNDRNDEFTNLLNKI